MKDTTTEAVLLIRAQKGDRRAFDLLCQPYYPIIFRYSLKYCRDVTMAEDSTQEAFFKAWKALPRFRGDSSLGRWLSVIATNVLHTAFRKKPNWVPLEDYDYALAENSRPDLAHDLNRAIAGLPKGARRVFNLYSIFGFGHRDIARMTGTAEGTSKAQLHRARRLLSAVLG